MEKPFVPAGDIRIDLRFDITAADLGRLAQSRYDARAARWQAHLDRLLVRHLPALLLYLPLAGVAITTFWPWRPRYLLEHAIATLFVVVLWGLFWRRYGRALAGGIIRLGQAVRSRTHGALRAALPTLVHSMRPRAAGVHIWRLSVSGIEVEPPSGGPDRRAWADMPEVLHVLVMLLARDWQPGRIPLDDGRDIGISAWRGDVEQTGPDACRDVMAQLLYRIS